MEEGPKKEKKKIWENHQKFCESVLFKSTLLSPDRNVSDVLRDKSWNSQRYWWCSQGWIGMRTNLQRWNYSERQPSPWNHGQDPWHSSPWTLPHSILPVTVAWCNSSFMWLQCFCWWASSSDTLIYPSIFTFPLLPLHCQSTTMHPRTDTTTHDHTSFIGLISLIW